MNVVKRCRYGMMIVNMKDVWQGKSFDLYGEYSESEVFFLKQVLKPGHVVLDVGANVGSLTVPMARFVGDTGNVVAIEPERRSFYTLCGNVALNNLKNVFCFQQAAGRQQGVIHVPELDDKVTVNWGGLELHRDYSKTLSYPVSLIRLDDLGIPRCDFIKIDVEGMEVDVLEGARGIIEKWRPYLYVDNDGRDPAGLHNIIDELGYDVYVHTAPLFNPNNYYENKENVFVTAEKAIVVSSMLYCVPREKGTIIDTAYFGMEASQAVNSNCRLAAGGKGTTTNSLEWRKKVGDFEKYLRGDGIDIGGGYDVLQTPYGSVKNWDVLDGDAKDMLGIPDNTYDFVYSSHCLEHVTDVELAIKNWARILKPGGVFFVCIPDWELYEQENWPSKFNYDHKFSFSMKKTRKDVGRENHYHLDQDLLPILAENGITLLENRLEDHRYDYNLPKGIDQTGPARDALAQICLIGRKHG